MSLRRFAGLAILLTASMLSIGQGWAESWQHTVSSQFSTEFDSNPAMSPTYSEGVWRALFEPSYTLTGRLGENELKTGLALQIARSSNKTLSPDRDSPTVFFDWLHPINAGELGISSRYAEVATRDAGIDSTGLARVPSTRVSRTVSGRWNKALTERSTLSADGSYEGVSYSDSSYVNYATRTVSTMFSYAWSESSTPFFKVSNADYEPTGGGPSSRLSTAVLGLNWIASDYLEGSLQIGKSKVSDAEMGTQGGASVHYTGQRSVIILSANRQVSPSGLGGFSTVDQANGSWSNALSERSRTGIDIGWQQNHLFTNIINRTASTWLQYELNSFWNVRTYYTHRITEQSGGGVAFSNILGIALVYTNPNF